MKLVIYSFLVSCLFLGCSSIFWREARLERTQTSFPGGKVFAEVLYEERDSWNPLMGTTQKRNYKTEISFSISGENPSEKNCGTLSSWTLPNQLEYRPGLDRFYWIQGTNDEYGTWNQTLGFANNIRTNCLKEQKLLALPFPGAKGYSSKLGYLKFLISPTGQFFAGIAIQESQTEGSKNKYFLVVWDTNLPSKVYLSEIFPNQTADPVLDPSLEIRMDWTNPTQIRIRSGSLSNTWSQSAGLK